jgi:hypothetical protein
VSQPAAESTGIASSSADQPPSYAIPISCRAKSITAQCSWIAYLGRYARCANEDFATYTTGISNEPSFGRTSPYKTQSHHIQFSKFEACGQSTATTSCLIAALATEKAGCAAGEQG